ncbi:ribokinase [Brachyspira pilosicoli WesB]|uniref:Ribokinase n=1 Tax=Brachyspira pilosicoli WesB TaxID=1161918 RepID=K0JGG5_BRAPL|nr:ribokinase [Brachyspira pilosicoli]MBW5377702.1 ribokinase [Brachyspira pilosicoli]WIH80500.1 ribokinase [Brachyspira pilosicoli]WIH84940.1 ribokinase [Brachyspira pilosicoli]CCG55877.1 ribokinase [Brachyspira pilosicoli WesB]
MSKSILVIGSINKDLVVNTLRFPKEGETILGNNFYTTNGGKGANQACAIGKLGGDVSMLGAVGNDNFAKDLSDALSSNNVNINNLLIKDNVSTGIAVITVTNDGANHIIVVQGANALITKDDVKEDLISSFDIIVMQLEIPLEIAKYAASIAKKLGKTVVLNPSPAVKLDRDFLSCVDILIPNETEIDIIGGVDYVLECGVKNIILTLGADGCELITKQNRKHFDAYKVNVVDTTAAGDSFLGGVVRMIADDKTIEEAIEFATKVSNITVTRKGAIDSIPTYNEVIDNY